MRIPGSKTARRLAHWLNSRFAPRALVLGYHRIERDADDPFELCTSPERFAEHLGVLQRETTPLGLDELLDGLDRGRLPRRAVAVTLDDGYADALHGAEPLLAAHGIPATVFVTSGLVGEVPWWEALAAAFPSARPLPERLSLDVGERRLGWEPPGEPTPLADARSARIRQLHRLLLDWPAELRDRAIEALARELAASAPAGPLPRGLTQNELTRLAEGGNIEIGAHSVHHPRLAELSEDAQRIEIAESKRWLEAALGRPVRAFSYPNGSNTARTRELVRESGFVCAFGSQSGVAAPGSDRYLLPRFWVGGADGQTLARLLRHWG